jgi:predicted DNA-binding protein with PD1-like motif
LAVAAQRGGIGCVVLAGIGSLSGARLRLAGAPDAIGLDGDLEILTLSGTLSPDGAHLHISVADRDGRLFGGHVAPGCVVRTTAEVLLSVLPEWAFKREMDAATGYEELVVRRIQGRPR